MKIRTFPLSVAAALVLGVAQTYVLAVCWTALSIDSPVPRWLIDHGARGSMFQAGMFTVDFAIHVIVSIPAAFILLQLRPARLRVFLAAAIVPFFLWSNVNVLGSWLEHRAQISLSLLFAATAMAWAQHLLPLPIAAWLLRLWLPGTPKGPAAPAAPVLSSGA